MRKEKYVFGISEITINQDNIVVTTRSSAGTPVATIFGSFVATLIITFVAILVTVPVNYGEKPEKFNGLNLKIWQ